MPRETINDMTEAEAAAELLAMHYRAMGVVLDVGVDGTIVGVTTADAGVHRGNVAEDYDTDVHLVCEPDEIQNGPLAGEISDEATVYWNEAVHGVAEDHEGGALPTHVSTKAGPTRRSRDALNDRTYHLGRKAGVYG